MHPLRIAILSFAAVLLVSSTGKAQEYERIDVDPQGQPGNPVFVYPTGADISHDGRWVAFISTASNLGGPDYPQATLDVFLRDRLLGVTTRVTSIAAGDQINAAPCIAGDGSMVAYSIGGYTNVPFRSFVFERSTGVTTEITAPGMYSICVNALNFDGTFAVLAARPAPLFPHCIYRMHLASGALVLCSRDLNGNPVAGGIQLGQYVLQRESIADIDDDGSHVAFWTLESNVVPGDTNGMADVFVYDVPGQVMLRASIALDGSNADQSSGQPSISGNGRYVAFHSFASNLIFGDSNSKPDYFMRDLQQGVTTVLSLDNSQALLAQGSELLAFLSADASSAAFPIKQQANSSFNDVRVRDVETGSLLPASPQSSTVFTEFAIPLAISGNGREVVIFDAHLSLGTWSSGGIFVAKLGPPCSSSGYCTALPNSTGHAAFIAARGYASRARNNLEIGAVGLPATAHAMLVSGASAVDPGTPFGNGLTCVGGTLIRHGIFVASEGVIRESQDMLATEYVGVNPGDTRYYQVVYRDPPAGGALFNTTDAVAVTFCW